MNIYMRNLAESVENMIEMYHIDFFSQYTDDFNSVSLIDNYDTNTMRETEYYVELSGWQSCEQLYSTGNFPKELAVEEYCEDVIANTIKEYGDTERAYELAMEELRNENITFSLMITLGSEGFFIKCEIEGNVIFHKEFDEYPLDENWEVDSEKTVEMIDDYLKSNKDKI